MIVPDNAFSKRTAVLNTLYQMQKSSTFTDCILVPRTGSPIHVHLAVLALVWPDLHHLLPPHCSCDCCVPTITLCADAKTVQLMVEVAYTGETVIVGTVEEEYEKMVKLSQSLRLKWVLEKVETRKEFKKPNIAVSPIKECLDKGLLLPAADVQEVIAKSVLDFSSISPDALRRSREGRKSLPRRVKINALHEKPKFKISKKKSVKKSDLFKPEECDPHKKVTANDENGNFDTSPSPAITCQVVTVKKTLIAPGTLMTNVDNKIKFFCKYCQQDITKFTKLEKESHWALVHFSEQLSQFITDQKMCKLCKFKVDDEKDIIKHVGVIHKKIYDFLSVVPPKVMARVFKARQKNLCTGELRNNTTPNYSQSNVNHSSADLNARTTSESVGTCLPNTAQHAYEFNINSVAVKENKDVEKLTDLPAITNESVCSVSSRNQSRPSVFHRGEGPFSCDECNFSTPRSDKMIVHKNVKHLKIGHQCSVCSKPHGSRWHLNKHMQTAHGDRICRICDRIFSNRRSLSKHMLSLSHKARKGMPRN